MTDSIIPTYGWRLWCLARRPSEPCPLHAVVEADDDNGLISTTAFQVERVRSVSTARFMDRLGRLDPVNGSVVDEILRDTLSL